MKFDCGMCAYSCGYSGNCTIFPVPPKKLGYCFKYVPKNCGLCSKNSGSGQCSKDDENRGYCVEINNFSLKPIYEYTRSLAWGGGW